MLALLLCSAVPAGAEVLMTLPDERTIPDADFGMLGISPEEAIPVYGAPFAEAWRGAEEEDLTDADGPFRILAAAQGDAWLLISRDGEAGAAPFGWIRTPEGFDLYVEIGVFSPERELYRVLEETPLTDDPLGSGRAIRTLQPGETVIGMYLLQNRGDQWILAETEQDGKTVWAFVRRDALTPEAPYFREGDLLVFREGVTSLGAFWGMNEGWAEDGWDGDGSGDPDNAPEPDESLRHTVSPVILPGELACSYVDLSSQYGEQIRQVRFPSSLRILGAEAVFGLDVREITLPGSLEYADSDAFLAGAVERIVIPADYTANLPDFSMGLFSEWAVAEGNPRYSSRDGVLFSADGKTLLNYPECRKETHYDVPPGTEVIARGAFGSGGIELQTISLPIGLKRIEPYAFSGCGRLSSLTVPLTVTEIGANAFSDCVSLGRLSLPPGLQADFSHDYSYREDMSVFMGDNGATLSAPGEYSQPSASPSIWLSGENGTGEVPVYRDDTSAEPFKTLKSGYSCYYIEIRNGRAALHEGEWVDLKNTIPQSFELFFHVSRVVPTEAGRAVLSEAGISDYAAAWLDNEAMTAHFYAVLEDREIEVTLRPDQFALYRPRTGDSRDFALLTAEDIELPVYILTAPSGETAAWTYTGEQAEVMERAEGWARIRTVAAEGWVREENLVTVTQEGLEP